MTEPDEQPLQVILAARLNLAALDVDIVDHDLLAPDQALQVEAERGDVGLQFLFRFLEGHQHARFVELPGTAHKEFRREQSLAAARAAADQRGPAPRQPAAGDFVETLDAGRTLGQTNRRGGGFGGFAFHAGASFL